MHIPQKDQRPTTNGPHLEITRIRQLRRMTEIQPTPTPQPLPLPLEHPHITKRITMHTKHPRIPILTNKPALPPHPALRLNHSHVLTLRLTARNGQACRDTILHSRTAHGGNDSEAS